MPTKPIQKLSMNEVLALRNSCNQFGMEAAKLKHQFLEDFNARIMDEVQVLQKYHDVLLFLLAYPENESLLAASKQGLQQCAIWAEKIANGNNEKKKLQLNTTGISNSCIIARFSFDMVAWLAATFPEQISLYSCDAEIGTQSEIIKILIPSIEREGFDNHFQDALTFLSADGNATHNTLQTLLDLFQQGLPQPEVRDQLFNQLQPYIQIDIGNEVPSRTGFRVELDAIYFHRDALIRKINLQELIQEKIGPPLKITTAKKEEIIKISRCALLMLLRETDPLTYANTNAVEWHDMGRGIHIALFYASTDRRMPLESYVGYMAFKNGVPSAYGGGWVLADFSRIGVNIFEPFRGGESALLFAQILRLYKQRFQIAAFEAEPYQIGKNNDEGIKSGAFWFYHRLGFRPAQEALSALAAMEQEKILGDKTYRTDEKTLKKLANSFMVLNTNSTPLKHISTLEISEWVTQKVNRDFGGNRIAYLKFAGSYVAKSLQLSHKQKVFLAPNLRDLTMLLATIPNLSEWNVKEKTAVAALYEYRLEDSEYRYIMALQKHQKIWKELNKLIHAEATNASSSNKKAIS